MNRRMGEKVRKALALRKLEDEALTSLFPAQFWIIVLLLIV